MTGVEKVREWGSVAVRGSYPYYHGGRVAGCVAYGAYIRGLTNALLLDWDESGDISRELKKCIKVWKEVIK